MEKQTVIPNREQRKYMTIAIALWWLCIVGRGQQLKGEKEKTGINETLKKKKVVKGWILDKAEVNTTLLKCQKNLVRNFSTFNTYKVKN